jgi:two-component system response regulator GlrR
MFLRQDLSLLLSSLKCALSCRHSKTNRRVAVEEILAGLIGSVKKTGLICKGEDKMIGKSEIFLNSLSLIERISRCAAPVLIEGETGTGKELAARAIHYGSTRSEFPFIPLNCGAIPDALIENELFGHQKGAYTDAGQDHIGLIQHAHGGTLFLDEVDALTPKAQVTLLRFLQDQHFKPLGGGKARSVDVRVIAATNGNIAELTANGMFRLDLMYRLKIMHMTLPPLRARRGDVIILAESFLETCTARYGRGRKTLGAETIDWFDRYSWPGNIRELENLIIREYLLAENDTIHIPAPPELTNEKRVNKEDRRNSDATLTTFKAAKDVTIKQFEKSYLVRLLALTEGNISKAATIAGKERRALGKLIKKHEIDKEMYM